MKVLHRHRLLPCAAPVLCAAALGAASAAEPPERMRSDPPPIVSSWDDLIEGVKTREDWRARRQVLKQRYLELIRDDQKQKSRRWSLKSTRRLTLRASIAGSWISYQRGTGRAGARLPGHSAQAATGEAAGKTPGKFPAIVALHGTRPRARSRRPASAAIRTQAWLDQLCRRGYVVIARVHFVAGHRNSPGRRLRHGRFYQKHPEWTAVGKFTYEHAIAIDLSSRCPSLPDRIGTLGHSLGGHGAYYLAAYDERVKAAVCNCGGAFFRHNPDVLNSARDRWYVYFKHLRPGLLEGRLPPIDRHEIIALVAPRPFMDLSGLNDGNGLVQRQRVLALLRIMDVYELEKAPQNFAFYVHGRGHAWPTVSRELDFGGMDVHLKPAPVTQTHLLSADDLKQTIRCIDAGVGKSWRSDSAFCQPWCRNSTARRSSGGAGPHHPEGMHPLGGGWPASAAVALSRPRPPQAGGDHRAGLANPPD